MSKRSEMRCVVLRGRELASGYSILALGRASSPCEIATEVGPNGIVTAVDISPDMNAIASRRATEAGLDDRIEIVQADAGKLDFPDGSFDGAVSTHGQPLQGRTTRRQFVRRASIAGTAVTGLGLLGPIAGATAATDADVVDFGNAAVGAERIAVVFYSNALGEASDFGVAGDVATHTLLNSGHRLYFEAAKNQESSHLAVLESLGLSFPYSTFAFPAGTFASASAMLAIGEQLERVFIGAYLGAVKTGAATGTATGQFVAEAAAQILGIECEHRVLIRDIASENPPNDRFYEGDVAAPPSGQLGDTGTRSTVYASGDDAVAALLALGIIPS
jgi:SAM-dependent methyltransferase